MKSSREDKELQDIRDVQHEAGRRGLDRGVLDRERQTDSPAVAAEESFERFRHVLKDSVARITADARYR